MTCVVGNLLLFTHHDFLLVSTTHNSDQTVLTLEKNS